ncbi:MAG: hypothetical protein QXP34_02545 [Candidatus Aenigmatarchaeota archaeon]
MNSDVYYKKELEKGLYAILTPEDLLGESLETFFEKCPPLSGKSINRANFIKILIYLTELGVNIHEVIVKYPRVLFLDPKEIENIVNYLENLGINKGDIRRIVEECPEVLGRGGDIEELKTITDFLFYVLRIANRDIIGYLFVYYPKEMCRLRYGRMSDVYEFLKTNLGIDDEIIKIMFIRNPDIFNQKPETIERKLKYLKKELGIEDKEIVKYIKTQPEKASIILSSPLLEFYVRTEFAKSKDYFTKLEKIYQLKDQERGARILDGLYRLLEPKDDENFIRNLKPSIDNVSLTEYLKFKKRIIKDLLTNSKTEYNSK